MKAHVSNDKLLCILVKFVSLENRKYITQLLELIPLNSTDCSADKLYSAFEKCFKSKDIPFNFINKYCRNGL